MVRWLLKLRWLAVVVASFSALHAIAFIVVGILRGIEGYRLIFEGPPWSGEHAPGIYIARSIDSFLLAMVFLVFSVGVTTLFLSHHETGAASDIPEWMRVENLSQLKFLIWEAILAALVVASVEGLVVPAHDLTWTALVVPVALLIMSAGLWLARKAH